MLWKDVMMDGLWALPNVPVYLEHFPEITSPRHNQHKLLQTPL